MDIDVMWYSFARYSPMLEEMYGQWTAQRERAARQAERQAHAPGGETPPEEPEDEDDEEDEATPPAAAVEVHRPTATSRSQQHNNRR